MKVFDFDRAGMGGGVWFSCNRYCIPVICASTIIRKLTVLTDLLYPVSCAEGKGVWYYFSGSNPQPNVAQCHLESLGEI